MNRTSRYARTGPATQQGPASVVRAIDPVTGLPVRLYRFAADPVPGAAALDHPHIYRVLEAGSDDDGGFVVAHVVDGASHAAERPGGLDDAAAVAATAALAAAARAGVVHGDVGPHRLHRRGREVWLEGYGVPWAAGSLADDAVALAAGLAGVHGNALSAPVRGALEAAAASADQDAEALARAVAKASEAASRAPAAEVPEVDGEAESSRDESRAATVAGDAAPDVDAGIDLDDVLLPGSDASAAAPDHAAPERIAPPSLGPDPIAPEPITPDPVAPDPVAAGPVAPSAPADSAGASDDRALRNSGSFSKRPPPDVNYRSGETPEPPTRTGSSGPKRHHEAHRQRRRTWLLVALVVLALVLALVTAIARRPVPPPTAVGGSVTAIVVDVRLEPASLPPASLVVVASPPGSQHTAGSRLGTVPRRVVFDAEGRWQVEGRFQERRSEIVTFELPAQRDVVLRFPDTP